MSFNKNAAMNIVFSCAAGIAFVVIYVKYLETKSVFFPEKHMGATPLTIQLPYEDVFIGTKDGLTLHSWYIPAQGARHTVIFCHGNAGNLSDRMDKIRLLHGLRVNVLIFDYRGYGKSQGKPTENGICMDAQAAYYYLLQNKNTKPGQIVLYGESLGGVAALELARQMPVRAVILEGVFSAGRDMAAVLFPWLPTFLFPDKYNNLKKVASITVPMLCLHSVEDEVVPFVLARKLFQQAGGPKQLVELRGSHNDAFLDSEYTYITALGAFLNALHD